MPNVISINAAQADIQRDVELTLQHAIARGTPYQEKAEAFLRPALDNLAALADRRKATELTFGSLRAQLAVEAERCDMLVLKVKDTLYNDLDRPAHDPIFGLWFPAGAATYTMDPPSGKSAALETLAGNLESTPHPRVPAERTRAFAAELRAAAIAIDGLNTLANPVRAQLRVLVAQHRTGVKLAHGQLSRLKKAWKSDGLTEVQIHTMIPDRPTATHSSATTPSSEVSAPVAAATVPLEVPPPASAASLAVVPPPAEPDDDVTEEAPVEGLGK